MLHLFLLIEIAPVCVFLIVYIPTVTLLALIFFESFFAIIWGLTNGNYRRFEYHHLYSFQLFTWLEEKLLVQE